MKGASTPIPHLSQSRLALMKARMTAWIVANPEVVKAELERRNAKQKAA